MKKLTFLLGTIGGAMAGYVLSNKKLRSEMIDAKDSSEAAKILGKHLSNDGQIVAKEVRQLAEQHGIDDRIADGKQYVHDYYSSAKDEVQKFLGAKVKEAKRAVGSVRKSVHTVRKAATKTKKGS